MAEINKRIVVTGLAPEVLQAVAWGALELHLLIAAIRPRGAALVAQEGNVVDRVAQRFPGDVPHRLYLSVPVGIADQVQVAHVMKGRGPHDDLASRESLAGKIDEVV